MPARRLHTFVQEAWHVVEPSTPFVDSWHVGALCEHLEACTCGEIRKLLVNIPPRTSKSLLVCVFWPAWVWITQPHKRWMVSGYAQHLSTRDSIKCRDVIKSPWYQQRWGDSFALRKDQNRKSRFDNDRSGFRLATSTGGVGTGEGGDFIIADDPHNVIKGESDAQRQAALWWWDQSMSTRGNDAQTVCHVVVMQRLHERDLAGHLLDQGGYEHLCLPMEYDPRRSCVTAIGWRDPRDVEGELLCESRFGRPEVDELKRRLGAYGSAGQLQQEPAPSDGGVFQRKYFRYFSRRGSTFTLRGPERRGRRFNFEDCWWFQTVDTAQKTGQSNDYTAIGTFAVTPQNDLLVVDVWRSKVEVPRQYAAILHAGSKYADWLSFQAIEDRQSGTGLIQQGRLSGTPFKTLKADTDKVRRASSVALQYENGKVYHRGSAPWLADFEDELLKFPRGAHDDQVDVVSYAGNLAVERALKRRKKNRTLVLWPEVAGVRASDDSH